MDELIGLLVKIPFVAGAILVAGVMIWVLAVEVVGWWVVVIFRAGRLTASGSLRRRSGIGGS